MARAGHTKLHIWKGDCAVSNLSELTTFFGWAAVLNISYLLLATLVVTAGRNFILSLHSSMLDMPRDELNKVYIYFLSYYKIATITLSVVPYLALKIMGN
jgi:Family of unknown function (DUF6868)